jgi:Zn-dependent protease
VRRPQPGRKGRGDGEYDPAPMDWSRLIPAFVAYALSLAFHESAHAWTAWRLGDTTGRDLGRITLNPIPHIDLFGTILLPLFLWWSTQNTEHPIMFGYAKPVPYNPYRLRNGPIGSSMVAGAGPASNFLLAGIGAAFLWFLNVTGAMHFEVGEQFLVGLVFVNVGLALFNLLPVPPLDGGTVVAGMLPRGPISRAWSALEPYGFVVLIALMYLGVVRRLVGGLRLDIAGALLRWAGIEGY